MSANCFVPKGSQAEKLVYWFVASRVLIDIKQASAYNRYMVARGDGVNLSAIGERQGVIGPNRCLFSGGGPICMENEFNHVWCRLGISVENRCF